MHLGGELGRQPASCRSRRAPASVTSAPPPARRLAPSAPAATRARRRGRRAAAPPRRRARAGGPAPARARARVVAQDRVLQRAELRPGLDAEVVGELLARLAVGVERLGLAAAAVEGEHQLPGEPLARRVLGDQLPQLADELGVPAGGQVGLDARLQRGQPLLLEPRDLGLRERLERQVGERRPAPQARAPRAGPRGVLGLPGGQRAPPVLDQPLEALGVELARLARAGGSRPASWSRSRRRRAPCAAARRAPARS